MEILIQGATALRTRFAEPGLAPDFCLGNMCLGSTKQVTPPWAEQAEAGIGSKGRV
jgi:hypothetical protein